ncbi:DUF3617 domain-containing protein [Massilia sp. 9096]|uniref:DUF3617 domain-containing protein n=1 Tax=Massilia sp. 9096 TaxID=1500894 RepID=UPI00068DB709|nr:DUF3617 domain-containing protein [Massilia sp. 9096]
MNIRTTLIALLASSTALALPAFAQDMKPGLWEQTNNATYSDGKVQANMSDIQKMIANLSPEQRQHVQQMMQQNGVQMDLANGAMSSKLCITREMIERKQLPIQEGDCRTQMTPAGDNRLQVSFTCTRPHASGEGEMTVDSPTTYRAQMRIHNQDQPNQVVNMDVAGRWLGADCGSVRPATAAGEVAAAKRKK